MPALTTVVWLPPEVPVYRPDRHRAPPDLVGRPISVSRLCLECLNDPEPEVSRRLRIHHPGASIALALPIVGVGFPRECEVDTTDIAELPNRRGCRLRVGHQPSRTLA